MLLHSGPRRGVVSRASLSLNHRGFLCMMMMMMMMNFVGERLRKFRKYIIGSGES
jgi:hypothetical protein